MVYSLDVLLFLFGTSLLFHVQFYQFLPDLHTGFSSQEKEMQKKTKWLSEEALQIFVKRREVKSKGEKERYTHLDAEVQRIARRDKKAFFSDQSEEI